jgi:membrane protein DedA with SNARE-associated domain
MSFLNGLHGTVAALLLAFLLYIDELGVPMPLSPNEVLLIVAGLLIAGGAMSPYVFLPLAVVAMTLGTLTGFTWARAVGSERLRAFAARLGAAKAYDRAAARVRRAGPLDIFVTRLIPGVRVYATLVAGAAGMDFGLFMAGAFPAIVIWAGFFTALGVLVGVPAEHLLRDVERLAATGFLLVALGAGSYIAIRRMPAASHDGDEGDVNVIDEVPGRLRVVLALLLDLAIITVIVAGLNRVVLSAFQLIHPNQLNDFIILVGSVVVLYVVITRRIPGQTAGEGLFDVSYRKRRGGGEGSADRDKTSKGATAKTGGPGGVRRRDRARDARDSER